MEDRVYLARDWPDVIACAVKGATVGEILECVNKLMPDRNFSVVSWTGKTCEYDKDRLHHIISNSPDHQEE